MSAFVRSFWRRQQCRCGHWRDEHHRPDDKRSLDWCRHGDCSIYEPADQEDAA